MELRPKNYVEGSDNAIPQQPVHGHYGNNYPAHTDEASFLGLSQSDLLNLAYNSPSEYWFSLVLVSCCELTID